MPQRENKNLVVHGFLSSEFLDRVRERAFSKTILLLALAAAGCATNVASLPNLPPGPSGGALSISTTSTPDGVVVRPYNFGIQTSGGSGVLFSCTVVAGSLPPGLNIAPSGSTCVISGTPTTAGSFAVTVQAVDTSSPPRSATAPYTPIVRPEFTASAKTPPHAVQARTYGISPQTAPVVTTTTLSPTPVPNTGQNTPGNGPLASCVATTSNPNLTAVVDPNNQSQCLLKSTAALTSSGSFTVTLAATDNPVLDSTGKTVVPANTQTTTFIVSVDQLLGMSVTTSPNITFLDNAVGTVGTLPDAVSGRTYGKSARSNVLFTATGGLSTTTGLQFALSGTLPVNVSCGPLTAQAPGNSAALTCNSSGLAVGTSTGLKNFTVTISDPGNSAVPSGSTSTDAAGHTSHNINVDPEIVVGAPAPDPNGNLAVIGRLYGEAPQAAPTYPLNTSGGLGGYRCVVPPGALPTNMACSAVGGALVVKTSGTGVSDGTPTVATPFNFTAAAMDTANDTTPANTVAGPAKTITVNPEIVVSPPAPDPNANPAVIGRLYGEAPQAAPTYPLNTNGGLGGYKCVLSAALPTNMACSVVGNALVVKTSGTGVSDSTPMVATPFNFTAAAMDTANATTPANTIPGPSKTITVNPALALAVDPGSVDPPPPGVQGRSYGNTAAGFKALVYDASNGLGGYSFSLPPSVTAPGGNGVPAPVTCTSNPNMATCTSGTAPIGGAGPAFTTATGTYPFTVTVTDTANATTPSAAASGTAPPPINRSITVNPEIVVGSAAPDPNTNPAVIGRLYGEAPQAAPTYPLNANGGLGGYKCVLTGTLPTNMACSAAGSALVVKTSGTGVSDGTPTVATPFNFTAAAMDTANATTPANTIAGPSKTITVNPEIVVSPPAPDPNTNPAVIGRLYGEAPQAAPTYPLNANGGLGGYKCVLTGALPTNMACSAAGSALVVKTSGTVVSDGTPTVATPFNFTVAAMDTANATTPANTIPGLSKTITVNPALTLAPNAAANAPAPAVNGRPYGTGTSCSGGGACTPLTYTASGGLPNSAGNYTFTPSTTLSSVLSCTPAVGVVETCNSVAVSAVAGNYSASMSVSDFANASTPSGSTTAPSPTPPTLAVNGALTLTPNAAANAPAPAVNGRPYGTGSGCTGVACTPLIYTASGGLPNSAGNYTFTPSTSLSSVLSCTQATGVDTCSSASVSAASGSYSASMTVADFANASTPPASISQPSPAATLVVDAALSLTPPAGTLATAVTGRTYGQGTGCSPASSCAAINYVVANGLGNYQSLAPLSSAAGAFACPLTTSSAGPPPSGTYSCSTSNISGSGSPTLTFTASETGNASTPGGTVSDNTKSLPINPALGVGLTTDPALASALAVSGRSYGEGVGFSAPTYTGTGGLPPYTVTLLSGAPPTGITCTSGTSAVCKTNATTVSGASGTYTIQVADTANLATPSGTATKTSTIKVGLGITITTTRVPNFLKNYDRAVSSTPFGLTAAGGLPAYAWSATGTCETGTHALPGGVSLLATSGIFSGGPTTASAAVGDTIFDVCVTDTPNTTTPSGTATTTYTITVLGTKGYVPSATSDAVEVIATDAGAAVPRNPSHIAMAAGSHPSGVAVTPDGLHTYVTLNGTNQIAVIDNVTDTVISTFSVPGGGTAPLGIAISPDGKRVYVADTGTKDVAVFTTAAVPPASALTNISTGTAVPAYVVFKPDGSRAYATTNANTILILDNTLATPTATGCPLTSCNLTAARPGPQGIAVVPNGASSFYGYIAKQNSGASGAVDVVDVTTDTPAIKTSIDTDAGVAPFSGPTLVAADPGNANIYVTLTGSNKFAVFDNTIATPTSKAGSPFSMVTLIGGGATDQPKGISIPPLSPLPVNHERVFIGSFTGALTNGTFGIINNLAPPTKDTSDGPNPFTMPPNTTASQVAHIPVPQ